jgi:hypothetical protein|tara:strand:+ start:5021 stop:5413 length:393 start_codon:yes stop_codon:yes gene_type:complete
MFKTMNKTITYLLVTLGILSLGVSQARTWTSADGGKTFRGDFVSYDKDTGMVKVTRGIRKMSFNADKLSEGDREWLNEQGASGASKALDSQKIGSKLKMGVLSRLEDGAFVDFAMTTAPEYYMIYYSGSW